MVPVGILAGTMKHYQCQLVALELVS